jgi:hypothetical protein
MCIGYLELTIERLYAYEWIAFLLFVFSNLLEKSFQNLLQIVKGIGIRLQEAFLRFEIPPPISNAFTK